MIAIVAPSRKAHRLECFPILRGDRTYKTRLGTNQWNFLSRFVMAKSSKADVAVACTIRRAIPMTDIANHRAQLAALAGVNYRRAFGPRSGLSFFAMSSGVGRRGGLRLRRPMRPASPD
jgi:hypothetical protein